MYGVLSAPGGKPACQWINCLNYFRIVIFDLFNVRNYAINLPNWKTYFSKNCLIIIKCLKRAKVFEIYVECFLFCTVYRMKCLIAFECVYNKSFFLKVVCQAQFPKGNLPLFNRKVSVIKQSKIFHSKIVVAF